MISGDFRSAVHHAAACPWTIHHVVKAVLEAPTDHTEPMRQYASEALARTPIVYGHPFSLGELVVWCTSTRMHQETLPYLAWAVVMRPTTSPCNNIGYSFCYGAIDSNGWGISRETFGGDCFGVGLCDCGPNGTKGDHAAYYNTHNRGPQ